MYINEREQQLLYILKEYSIVFQEKGTTQPTYYISNIYG